MLLPSFLGWFVSKKKQVWQVTLQNRGDLFRWREREEDGGGEDFVGIGDEGPRPLRRTFHPVMGGALGRVALETRKNFNPHSRRKRLDKNRKGCTSSLKDVTRGGCT